LLCLLELELGEAAVENPEDCLAADLDTTIQDDGAKDGLKRVSEYGVATSTASVGFAGAESQPLPYIQLSRQPGQRTAFHQGNTKTAELPFVGIGKALVQGSR
jgi:hypothetical protein